MPAISAGWRYQRRAPGAARAAVAADGARPAGAWSGPRRSPVEPHSRVERRVGDVGEQVDQDDQHGEDQGDALDDREVAVRRSR